MANCFMEGFIFKRLLKTIKQLDLQFLMSGHFAIFASKYIGI